MDSAPNGEVLSNSVQKIVVIPVPLYPADSHLSVSLPIIRNFSFHKLMVRMGSFSR